ncbi:MAG: hypothetical protein DLM66_00175 [Candidatus Dormiibacter spiritus]|nr:MAG: hypothetical protein DLM66_00175 [Candidatus Dormibacteraeota bacterium]
MSETNAQLIGPYRKGEIPPPIVVTFKDYLGNVIDLTGYAVHFVYRAHTLAGWPDYTTTDPTALDRVGSLLSGPLGQAQYTWVTADFAGVGFFEGEMWAGNGTNRYSSVRYQWQVYDAILVPSI